MQGAGSDPATAYQAGRESPTTPVKQVALLYDRILESLNLAQVAVANDAPAARHAATAKAGRILTALCAYLDFEQGGDFAEKLHQLYRYILARLVCVDLDNDAEPLREAIGLLSPIRDAWHEAADRMDNMPEVAAPPARERKMPGSETALAYGEQGTTTASRKNRGSGITI